MLVEIKYQPTEGAIDTAECLRDLANKLEKGECRNVMVIGDIHTEKVFIRSGDWEDTWRLLGAIEYAKEGVLRGMNK
jgi:hypothetical protein